MRIGFLGTGTMGLPMAENLLRAGYSVTAYNRSPEKVQPLLQMGGKQAQNIAEAVRNQDVVISMLSDDSAVREVYLGNGGVAENAKHSFVAIDMSTVSPGTALEVQKHMNQLGIAMLDAPVSGSAGAAKEAKLLVLAGGPLETYEITRPILAAMSQAQFYFGPGGNGAKAKLVVNLLLALTMQGISEALVLAETLGLSRSNVLDMLSQSSVASPFLGIKKQMLIDESFPPAFALKYMRKDLNLILQAATEREAVLPATSAAFASYTSAMHNGFAEDDLAAVMMELLRQSGYTGAKDSSFNLGL
ncbi:NAD(P)-dependent oxidoreductase [Alicyclobacillus tolerans]|uniref:3-hydroxyisobutyrate dehydrogenase-like beta-hydroxyacid dehydrogenase n=1 Tax=Alicyclobacillus tolerans TaxID=90970 RepID=A0ABT9LUK8_9BACL|nr:NAD(P)-dependent oxidoreductase [Alicyclobacillus tengchongensis]MDP9727942.1 3-hydroxyisobutyrate dehydrogenase-like beta-hydroxyacid dehydrogenase [Alicyclobacillus tengchongensis]